MTLDFFKTQYTSKDESIFDLNNYHYNLPPERIAHYPLKERSNSKLLIYKDSTITHNLFYRLDEFLDKETTLVFNDTRVLPARLFFKKPSGAQIEVLLLQPQDNQSIKLSLESTLPLNWICLIDNLRRWKNGSLVKNCLIEDCQVTLKATLLDREKKFVRFEWTADKVFNFGQIIETMGVLPIPPYLKRKTDKQDSISYQTVYSRSDGAVAAPTAGLHFTKTMIDDLAKKVQMENLTLWIGLGTFKPVMSENILHHDMHEERFSISIKTIKRLIKSNMITAVGTTSLRVLESLYWFGLNKYKRYQNIKIEQFVPYQNYSNLPHFTIVLQELYEWMSKHNIDTLQGETSIFIFPSYRFQVCKGLITNFHFPKSTLLMLIAAFIGDDWKKVYIAALKNNYRFLSYGDSSLIFRS